ncbi:MAG: glycosyltransferase family 10 [Helicobacter sp.]|nr:glycosyltransferase family 10 [Helicobacter sp.]
MKPQSPSIHFVDGCIQEPFLPFLPKDHKRDAKNPDFIFYSVFGTAEHVEFDGVRIFYTGENARADFNFCDYAISFDYLEFEDRHLRYPYYLFSESFRSLCKNERQAPYSFTKEHCARKFCSFVVSNGKADSIREEFFEALCLYKHVDSGGRYKNNIGKCVDDKQAFLSQYKFNIAFENSATHGYITEKIFDAKLAGSVPIYWGDSSISKPLAEYGGGLNPKAFVNICDFKNPKEAIEFVKFLDSSDGAYLEMLNAPLLMDKDHDEIFDRQLAKFLDTIFSQGRQKAYRRGFGQWRLNIETRYKKFQRTRRILTQITHLWRLVLSIPKSIIKKLVLLARP